MIFALERVTKDLVNFKNLLNLILSSIFTPK